jgi:hypothetical protein
LIDLFGEDVINDLKSTSQKKKAKAIISVKQIFSKSAVNINKERAKRLFEPISFLMRLILGDQNSPIYLESLKLLKLIISTLAPHLDTLDLHILIGSFVGMIVSTVSPNMRIQIQVDKVIIFLAKHNNIGPLVVA